MNNPNKIKTSLKEIRWSLRRKRVALAWGSDSLESAPIVFGNAMPKSGSHLIFQVLQGLPEIGPFVVTGFPPVNRNQQNQKLDNENTLRNIQIMKSGDIGYGYIHSSEPFISELTRPDRATLFIYRDPRDVVVSHVYYATEMYKGHGMNRYYNEELHTMEERINAAICGVDVAGSELNPIYKKFRDYTGWLDIPEVLCMKFESLIENRNEALEGILDFLGKYGFTPKISRNQAIETLRNAIAPGRSGTYRKGKTGNWRDLFTDQNKNVFKENTGDLLINLGYESDQNW